MKNVSLFLSVLVCGLAMAAHAEFRVWTAKDGSSNIEAQFVQMSGKKVVLEKKDGKRIMVPKDKLCSKDLEYLASVVPPKLKIEVDKDVSREDTYDSGYTTGNRDTITISVSIKKTNREPSTKKFNAYLYIIGKSYTGNGRDVIGADERSFSFDRKSSINLSGSGTVHYYDGKYSGKRGWKYEGYIVVVENEEGGIVMVDTNKSSYETNLNKIKKGGRFSM